MVICMFRRKSEGDKQLALQHLTPTSLTSEKRPKDIPSKIAPGTGSFGAVPTDLKNRALELLHYLPTELLHLAEIFKWFDQAAGGYRGR